MVVVGVGSIMFHATMRFKFELLDEVPMVLIPLLAASVKSDTHWIVSGRFKLLYLAAIWGAGLAGLGLYFLFEMYELFLHTFAICVVLDILVSAAIAQWPEPGATKSLFGQLYLGYVGVITFGKIVWEIEYRFCPVGSGGPMGWLHVAWHFLSGLAVYLAMMANTHLRHASLGIGCAVDEAGRAWPLVARFHCGSAKAE